MVISYKVGHKLRSNLHHSPLERGHMYQNDPKYTDREVFINNVDKQKIALERYDQCRPPSAVFGYNGVCLNQIF